MEKANPYLKQLYYDINGPVQKTLQDIITEFRKIGGKVE